MKKTIITFLISAILISSISIQSTSADGNSSISINDIKTNVINFITDHFTDITNHWAIQSILQAVQKGYVAGYPDGSFKPDANVTRAEFIKLIVASLGLPVSSEATTNWYDPYVQAAQLKGIYVEGDFTSGDLNTPMTRFEMSRAAVRATGQTSDDPDKWMYLSTKSGLIQGMDTTGTLGENQSTTRAQSITVIERILTINSGGTLPADKHAVSRAEVLWHKTNIFTLIPEVFNKKQVNGMPIDMWDKNNLTVQTKNNLFKADLAGLIVVDLADKNDPYMSMVPAGLKWYNYPVANDVRNYPNSYLIFPVSELIYNKDPNTYGDTVLFDIAGFNYPANSDSLPKDKLVTLSGLTLDGKTFVHGYILPKDNMKFDFELDLHLAAPGLNTSDVANKTILTIRP
jgi:hypothetical protein